MSNGLGAVGFVGGLALGLIVSFFLGMFVTDPTVLDDSYRSGYNSGFEAGKVEGYGVGFVNGSAAGAGSGFNIRDPTYAEVIGFVEGDKTDSHLYNMVSYNCFHFCRDFKAAAFDAGLKAGFVYVEFADGAHALVCFDTVDRGLVFVEPQTDGFVSLVVGGDYEFVEAPNTVVAFTVVW